jgi:hypothetical protein
MHYLRNPYFWAGELGLFLLLVSTIVLLYRFRHDGWLAVVPVFIGIIMTLRMLVHPVIIVASTPAPNDAYLFRLALGVLVASLTWKFSWGPIRESLPEELRTTRSVLKYATIGGSVLIAGIIWKLRHR